MDDFFNAWLAGFFDGEGCISVKRPMLTLPYVNVQVSQNNIAVLGRIQEKFGGKIHQGFGNCSMLSIDKQADVIIILSAMHPFLLLKKAEAGYGIALASAVVTGGKHLTEKEKLVREILAGKLKEAGQKRREETHLIQ